MKLQVTFKGFEEHARPDLSKWIEKLERQLKHVPQDELFLHGSIERHLTRSLYRISLMLHVPRRTLVATEQDNELEVALKEAFTELERQVEKYKAFLRHEPLWKRQERREDIRKPLEREQIPVEERDRALLLDLIQTNLNMLYNFCRREIAACLATGDLPRGYLTVEDLVDAVVLRAAREFHQRPASLPFDRWLLKLAVEQIEDEVKRIRGEVAQTVPIEEDTPETPPDEQVRTLGDEIYDFYQPDEDLRLEDILPAPFVPTPEQVVESRDVQRYVNRTLAKLPATWRRAFVLMHVEGCDLAETAQILGMQEDEVARAVESAREFLRQKLIETGLEIAA